MKKNLRNILSYYQNENVDQFFKALNNSYFKESLNPDTSAFKLFNKTPASLEIGFELKLDNKPTLDELFNFFCLTTHNVVTDGDFRLAPEVFYKNFQTINYFLFNGDGYCTSLAFMFKELASKYGYDVIVGYCRTPDSHYTHAYCFVGNILYDPALKTISTFEDLKIKVPIGWIYTLIKRGSLLEFDSISAADKKWVFDDVTIACLDEMNSGNHQLVYLPTANLPDVHKYFLDAFFNKSIEIDMRKNDFSWKGKYNNLVLKEYPNAKILFFNELDKKKTFTMPANTTLETGDTSSDLITSLEAIFYGRKAICLNIKLEANKVFDLKNFFPEPYLIYSKSESLSLEVNGVESKWNQYKTDVDVYIGRGQFGRSINSLKSNNDLEVTIVYFINSLFFNSPFIKMTTSEGIQVEHR